MWRCNDDGSGDVNCSGDGSNNIVYGEPVNVVPELEVYSCMGIY